MKRLYFLYISLIALLFCSSESRAQVGLQKVAQSTMNFQLVGISPKASAMGEACYALGGGAESIFYNPAGIVESPRTFDVQMYVTQWIADINYMAGAVAWNLGVYGTVGFSALTVDYGTINSTRLLHISEIELYPAGYKDLGSADNVGAYSFGISYGKAISDRFLVGGNVRLAGQNLGQNDMGTGSLEDNNLTKLVFDAGVKYYTGYKSFRFGMAIRNFSSNARREEIDEQLPLTFTMGAAMNLFDVFAPLYSENNALTVAVDFLHSNHYTERINMGLEYKMWNMLALRGGYQTNRDLASWSAGIGLNTSIRDNDIEFNYSYSNVDIFDGVTRFSLGIAF